MTKTKTETLKLTKDQQKALKDNIHISLTANAGSGKTAVLTERYLKIAVKLAKETDTPLQRMAAITFTEKAAGELYRKIAKKIEDELAEASDKTEKALLSKLRQEMIYANISTIHSFCINILRKFPVEADIDANFTTIDTDLSKELLELSVEELIRNAAGDTDSEEYREFKYLVRVLGSVSAFSNTLIDMIENRQNTTAVYENLYKDKDTAGISKYFEDVTLNSYDELLRSNLDKVLDALVRVNTAALENDAEHAATAAPLINTVNTDMSTIELLESFKNIRDIIFTGTGELRKAKYLKSGDERSALADEIDLLTEYFDTVDKLSWDGDADEVNLELAAFGKIIGSFFEKGLAIYNRRKKENGYLDFEDLLLITKRLLANDDVQEVLAQEFDYLMIDEYQDTNEIQYHIFKPLLDDLKKGKLFVVGDEKQSIYRFRNAELEVFKETKVNIEDSKGETLTLPDSFRMAPPVCAFTNIVFEKIFSDPVELYNEVAHNEIICAKSGELEGYVETLLYIKEDDDNERELDGEAELTAQRLLELMNDDDQRVSLEWKDIGILCRKRKSFAALEDAFLHYNIPYSIVGGRGFYQRQLVYDYYNYFSFLLNSENSTALTGLLRSPFFSLPDSEIFKISAEKEDNLWEKLKIYSNKHDKYSDAVKTLEENLNLVNTMSISDMLRKITDETPYLSVIAARPDGIQETANYQKLLNLTIKFVNQGFRTLYDYVTYLKESIEDETDEGQAALPEESDAVQIMTVHQAKGLEFKAVVLFNSQESLNAGSVKKGEVKIDKRLGLLTKVPVGGDFFSSFREAPVTKLYNYIEIRKEIAELKRLFYVACTRAKNYLFITATPPKTIKPDSKSFISLLSQGFSAPLKDVSSVEKSAPLTLLKNINDEFKKEEQNIDLTIPVITEIKEAVTGSEKKSGKPEKADVDVSVLTDTPSGEIVSATKLSIFKQCPMKYQLTYEFGYSAIYKDYKKWREKAQRKTGSYEFNLREELRLKNYLEDASAPVGINIPEIRGRITHTMLERNIDTGIKEKVKEQVENEFGIWSSRKDEIEILSDEITALLEKYYNSKTHKQLSAFNRSYNEYEIYTKGVDYFLYGIIDKLIIKGKKAIIIDYKTDDITAKMISARGGNYLQQLKFYAYLVKKHFTFIDEFELMIIFLHHPDKPYIKNAEAEEIDSVKDDVEKLVSMVREGNFPKNRDYCKECFFSPDGVKCINRE